MCGKPPAFRCALYLDEAPPLDREAEPRYWLREFRTGKASLTAHQAAEPRLTLLRVELFCFMDAND
jgi:hypothetical protein